MIVFGLVRKLMPIRNIVPKIRGQSAKGCCTTGCQCGYAFAFEDFGIKLQPRNVSALPIY
jgi:hypothetical protein